MPGQAGTAHENDCTAARRPLLTFIQDYADGWRIGNCSWRGRCFLSNRARPEMNNMIKKNSSVLGWMSLVALESRIIL